MPLEDIFSFRSRKSIVPKSNDNSSNVIIADFREKNSLVISGLVSLGVTVDFRNLKVGDFLVGEVVVERKSVNDFISSMINKRLIKQLIALKSFKDKFLLIEGLSEKALYDDKIFRENKSGVHPNAIRGFLLSIILDFRIPIIFTKNSDDSAKFIHTLLNRLKKSKKPFSLREGFSMSDDERLLFILEGFPSIGPATSRKLLSHFGTLNNIFSASLDGLRAVIGIKAVKIHELLNKSPNKKFLS